MKKIIILILVLALGSGLIYWLSHRKVDAPELQSNVERAFRPDPSSATFTFDGEAVTLSNGRKITKDQETGMEDETELMTQQGHGDLNTDGKDDTALFLSRTGGGSGVFLYVAAYVSGPVNYKGSNAVFLGDRIVPQSVSISNGILTAKWLDRKADEPFGAEPTLPTSKQFVIKNGELVER